ncbi:364_t:CDS:10 [Diversispora eburnea]|uniref:Phospholipase n=1 Tax=Diversispora eburnea TaxID=1213867 RepID=A0A9N8VZU6_9GLOM|nr:364_t:CDS:10 [Diversispora eburnea]
MVETEEQNGSNSNNSDKREHNKKARFGKNTLALLEAHTSNNSSDTPRTSLSSRNSESSDNEDIGDNLEPETNWQQVIVNSFFKLIGEEQPRSTTHNSERSLRSRRKNSKGTSNTPFIPTAAQLNAPYIEEQDPENYEFLGPSPDINQTSERHSIDEQSNSMGEPGPSKVRESLKESILKTKKLATVNRIFSTPGGKKHLQDTNVDLLSFPSLIAVPLLWARKDHKDRRSPPILVDFLKLAITDSYIDADSKNWQNSFRIELEYGDVKWVVKRTGFDFITLHLSLNRRTDLPDIPRFPSGITNWFRANLFNWHTTQVSRQDAARERREELEKYLIALIKSLSLHVAYDLYEFLELSAISITRDMGWKGKEGYIENKVERIKKPICFSLRSGEKWEREWVIVRDSDTTPADVFLFDKDFLCEKINPSGINKVIMIHDHVSIGNSYRRIEMKADVRTLKEFMESVERVKLSSPWVKQHRFDSYAPIRKKAKAKWYIDGKDYLNAVSQAILAATSEIYIEDWWLSPELYLRRPPSENEEFRLDNLLKKKAEEGVMIYIVVYKEVKLALTLDSQHTKTHLRNLHPNIKVQRHPDHGLEGTVFWAKMVVIDSHVAFIGGLDLCFGRYDTHEHELSDLDKDKKFVIWPGQDYSNPRIKDFADVAKNALIDNIERDKFPRMPWHDIAIGMVGQPARDVARHFVRRWNFIKEEKSGGHLDLPFLLPKGEYVSTRDESRFKGTCNAQLLLSSTFWSTGTNPEYSIYNAYCHLIRNSKHFIYIENQFFVTSTENDPNYEVKNLIGGFLVERIIKAHKSNAKFRVIVVMPLLPAFEADLNSNDAGTIRMVMHWQYVSICRGGRSVLEKIKSAGVNPEDYISFFALRNYGKISQVESISTNGSVKDKTVNINPSSIDASVESNEDSQESKNHENEFPNVSENNPVDNKQVKPSGDANNKFVYITEEVYIHSKLLIVDDKYVIIGSANLNDRSQLGYRDSEIAILIEDKSTIKSRMDGNEYMASKFAYTLRNALFKEHLGLLEYQDHSSITKSCLSPDDPRILREMLKEKDPDVISSLEKMAPENELKHPTKEDLIVMDPLSDEFYDYWSKTAQRNTEVYRSVFRCVPDDNVTTWEKYENFVPDRTKVPIGHAANQADVETIKDKLSNVRGHLVEFPTRFLQSENLLSSVISNAVTPAEIFT